MARQSSFIIATLLIFLALPLTRVAADTVMYCSSEHSIGVYEENGSYSTQNFKMGRFTVKVDGDFDEVTIGKSIFDCRPSYDANFDANKITCFHDAEISNNGGHRVDYGGLPLLFFYNRGTNRFTYFAGSTEAYASNGPDSDNLYAGRCESF